jgi:hypothetical protein
LTFALTSIFVALVFWRPQEWLLPFLEGWPILDVVVALAAVAFVIEVRENRLRLPLDMPQVYLLPGLWSAAILSHVAHTYLAGALGAIVPAFKMCFFALLLMCAADRPARLRVLARIFIVMACIMSVHALLQEKRGFGFAGLEPLRFWKWTEFGFVPYTRTLFFGIFQDPNDFAQILATALPFAFVIMRRRSVFSVALAWAIVWLVVRGILSTRSRGGLVALTTVTVLFLTMRIRGRWQPWVMGVLISAALIAMPFASPILDQSAHDRVVFWGLANEEFRRTPLFGVGFGMFVEICDDAAAHNAFVQCYTEVGVYGYWFWIGLLLMGLLGAWRARAALARFGDTESVWMRRFTEATICGALGYTASSYFLSRAFVQPTFFITAILAATYLATCNYLGPENVAPFRPRRDLLVTNTAAAVGSILYIYASIRILNRIWYG